MRDYLEIACDLLGISENDVLSSRVYEEQGYLAMVVYPGPKYIIPLDELQPEPIDEPAREIVATTEAMAYAREHEVDLTTIDGTGKNGRILMRDVKEAL